MTNYNKEGETTTWQLMELGTRRIRHKDPVEDILYGAEPIWHVYDTREQAEKAMKEFKKVGISTHLAQVTRS